MKLKSECHENNYETGTGYNTAVSSKNTQINPTRTLPISKLLRVVSRKEEETHQTFPSTMMMQKSVLLFVEPTVG